MTRGGWFSQGVDKQQFVQLMGDPSGEFTKAVGMEMTHPGPPSVGIIGRSKRFAIYLEDGVVKLVQVIRPTSPPPPHHHHNTAVTPPPSTPHRSHTTNTNITTSTPPSPTHDPPWSMASSSWSRPYIEMFFKRMH